ncbi:MAG: hypothetical protein V1822_04015 [Candidatus Micrarchaeota archaeon]
MNNNFFNQTKKIYCNFKGTQAKTKLFGAVLLLTAGLMLKSCTSPVQPVINRNSNKYGAVFERDSAGIKKDTIYVAGPRFGGERLDIAVIRSGRSLNGDTTATISVRSPIVLDTTITFGDYLPIRDYTYRLMDIEKPAPDNVEVAAVGTIAINGANNGLQAIAQGTSNFLFRSGDADSSGSYSYFVQCSTDFSKIFEGYRSNLVFANNLSKQPAILQPQKSILIGDEAYFILSKYMARFDAYNPPVFAIQFDNQKQTLYCDSSNRAWVYFSGSDTLSDGMVKYWSLSGMAKYPTTVPLVAMFAYGVFTYEVSSPLGHTMQTRSGGLEKEYNGREITMSFGGRILRLISVSNPAEPKIHPQKSGEQNRK